MGTEPQGTYIDILTIGDASLIPSTVESIQKDWSGSHSVTVPGTNCKSFSGIWVANLPADDLSVSVIPEDVLTDSAPVASDAKLHPSFKSTGSIS